MAITKQLLNDELVQRREEGADVDALEAQVQAADPDDQGVLAALYARLEALGSNADMAAAEPSDLEGIQGLRAPGPRAYAQPFSESRLADRLYGAWLGRAAGCLLGKPCEGWSHDRIRAYLEPAGEYPLNDYFPLIIPDPLTGQTISRVPADWYRGRICAAPVMTTPTTPCSGCTCWKSMAPPSPPRTWPGSGCPICPSGRSTRPSA